MAVPSKKKRVQSKHKSGKGGGGKKARIAAQRRDRYWGEDVEETGGDTKVKRRPGEGRRGPLTKKAVAQGTRTVAGAETALRDDDFVTVKGRHKLHSDDDSASSEDDNKDSTLTPQHFSKLMESLSSNRHKSQLPYASDEDDESVDSRASLESQGPSKFLPAQDDTDSNLPVLVLDHLAKRNHAVFTDHFSREPLVDTEIPNLLLDLHTNTSVVTLDDASLEVQVSNKLIPALRLDWSNEPLSSTEKRSIVTSRQTVRRRARQYLQSTQTVFGQEGIKAIEQNLVAATLIPPLRTYADILLTTESDPSSGSSHPKPAATNVNSIHTAVGWHIVKHVHQSRSAIDGNNRRLRRAADKDNSNCDTDAEWCRDQGFTRPIVLVLLPTRHCCYDFVASLLTLMQTPTSENSVINMDRFETEYGPASVVPEGSDGAEEDRRRSEVLRQKGAEWNDLFGDDRNDDDDFKIGLQLNWKRNSDASDKDKRNAGFSGKLYSDFYRSDIIIASPLGLKMITQASVGDDDDDESPENARGLSDFLSSIEICWVARADVLWHQNWDHVPDILSLINQRPQAMNETDFSRVRQYQLAGQAANWRQLIISSSMSDPSILSSFKRYAMSTQGIAKIKQRMIAVTDSSIASVWWPNVRQVFQRVSTMSFASASDDRLKYFMHHIWPKIEGNHRGHTMIYIPSYFDFCSLRNALLQKQEQHRSGSTIDFVSVTEYSRATEVARGRARFLQGRKPVLLYTGRAHYFLRHAIKGVRHLIFFGLPEVASFYTEHVNRLNEGLKTETGDELEDTSCLALFTKFDALSLERIVGSVNCKRMVRGEKSTFLFSSS